MRAVSNYLMTALFKHVIQVRQPVNDICYHFPPYWLDHQFGLMLASIKVHHFTFDIACGSMHTPMIVQFHIYYVAKSIATHPNPSIELFQSPPWLSTHLQTAGLVLKFDWLALHRYLNSTWYLDLEGRAKGHSSLSATVPNLSVALLEKWETILLNTP